ncbi:hypothetical protein AKJ50_02425 [candidate division MSBL1 archaeon SCGC-AAA382A13]|uniref:Uncharacterized protein n=1 Tax=candidate division MSBL1 archaeon SCGC-AAA382A13 TaxID=1698279 RepID=A0A133VD95_9EURY|nr:hypothetical protein AKJ50_02425 [candidate division MSBL1 archaeon SCGC-AAA382A13]
MTIYWKKCGKENKKENWADSHYTGRIYTPALERAYDNPHVAMILREVFEMSQESVEDEEDTFSPDGTGIPNSMKNNWEKESDDEGSEGGSEKFTQMIAMMGATYQLISSVKFPDNP